jgi:hypothetical protein
MKQGSLENRYKAFFDVLEKSFREELKNAPYTGVQIINNYALKGEYNVTVQAIVADNIKVFVICDTTFPNTDKPKVFCAESYNSPVIDKRTREVNYSGFYQWIGKMSKVIDLLNSINTYFQKNPPVKNLLMKENFRLMDEVQAMANAKLIPNNVGPLENQLAPNIRDQLWSQESSYQVLQQAADVLEIKKKMVELTDRGLTNAGSLKRRNQRQNRNHRLDQKFSRVADE